ncbi:TPA: hypothetical protein HA281_02310 [Candidatus Woesearchaeota archaeon]|nr:hypothetical protein [Candidatus Woesearchaeota archaeon]HII65684.1 hypothetical protein [Candidatus Woesearchaeota archaeon]HIJ19162.1 hypothetical protein [Candidatus Woesearchaeota archaeon]
MDEKYVYFISYNPLDAGNKPIETWAGYNVFRTGERSVLTNVKKGDRIVLYDTARGLVAEFRLIRKFDLKTILNNKEKMEVYKSLICYPLYPFDSDDMYENGDEKISKIHLFYDKFKIYSKIPSIEDTELRLNLSSDSLRQQNGKKVEESLFDNFLNEEGVN